MCVCVFVGLNKELEAKLNSYFSDTVFLLNGAC